MKEQKFWLSVGQDYALMKEEKSEHFSFEWPCVEGEITKGCCELKQSPALEEKLSMGGEEMYLTYHALLDGGCGRWR